MSDKVSKVWVVFDNGNYVGTWDNLADAHKHVRDIVLAYIDAKHYSAYCGADGHGRIDLMYPVKYVVVDAYKSESP